MIGGAVIMMMGITIIAVMGVTIAGVVHTTSTVLASLGPHRWMTTVVGTLATVQLLVILLR